MHRSAGSRSAPIVTPPKSKLCQRSYGLFESAWGRASALIRSHERVDECAEICQALDPKPRLCNKLIGRSCIRLGHPGRQERERRIRLADDKVIDAGGTHQANRHDRLPATRVKRIKNPNLKRRTPGNMTLLRAASARAGSPLRSGRRPAGRISPSPPIVCPACSRPWRWRAPTGTMPELCARSSASICSSSTTGGRAHFRSRLSALVRFNAGRPPREWSPTGVGMKGIRERETFPRRRPSSHRPAAGRARCSRRWLSRLPVRSPFPRSRAVQS